MIVKKPHYEENLKSSTYTDTKSLIHIVNKEAFSIIKKM